MDLSEIIIGQKCKCDYGDGQYFAFVKEKKDGRVGVQLTDKVEAMVIRLALISFATSRRSPALPAPPLSW